MSTPSPSPDPGQPAGAQSSSGQDILASMAGWLGTLLTDIIRLLADAEASAVLLAEFGWEGSAPALPSSLLSRLVQAQGGPAGAQQAEAETFGEVLVALAALVEAMTSAGSGNAGVSAAEMVADMLDWAAANRIRHDHPVIWAILRLLALLTDDGAQLANLGNLVGDTRQYLSGLVQGPGYAQAYQDYSAAILGTLGTAATFIPSKGTHGRGVDSFRSEVMYGWAPVTDPDHPDVVTDHPNLMTVLGRTMTWRVDAQQFTPATSAGAAAGSGTGSTAGDSTGTAAGGGTDIGAGLEETVDLTVVLVPPEHNDGSWGVFLRLAGSTALSVVLGSTGWQFTVSLTDGAAVEALLAANGFIRGTTAGFKASVALERPDDISGSWVVGSKSGSHVEIQHARVAVTVTDDPPGPLLDFGVHADHVIVNVALGQDSFLRSALPPSLRLDTSLGLGVDTRRGFYLNGGVALVADLPVNVVLGPAAVLDLALQALHLRLGFTTPNPQATSPSSASFQVALTVDAAVQVAGGVVQASVAGVGAAFSLKQVTSAPPGGGAQTAGHWQPSLDVVPPNGLGIVVNAGPVSGGGYIGYDASSGEYTGALQLHIGLPDMSIDITALGMLDTKIPGHDGDWALILILAVAFSPGIQLGMGFTLGGVGGVLGVNHTLDSDVIAAGLRTKSLDAILFPPNPVAQAPHIFAVWRQTMPIVEGHVIVGPMLRLGWGGAANLLTLDLAILIELDPSPVQIVLLGRLQVVAPTASSALVRLRADVLGRLIFSPLDFLLQAELVDSRIGTFTVSGGLVIVARGGQDAAYVLSVGGFNPHFTPPSNVPVADRIRADVSGSDNPRLRLEAYLALTSQTFQFGARVELHAAAGPLALDGWLGLDVLIEWLPHFRFSAEISAGLSLSFNGSPVLEVAIDILFEGPGPWHVKGYASLSLLFFTLSLPIDHTWGDDAGPTAQTAQPLTLVHDALSAPDAWSAALPAGTPAAVILRAPAGPAVPAHPLAAVGCRQRVVPLGMQITHVGSQPLDSPTTVDVTGITLGGSAAAAPAAVTDEFAAGQFLTLTDDQALSRPSFEPMRAGLSADGAAADLGSTTVVAATYKTVAVDGATRIARPAAPLDLAHAIAILRPAPPPTARPRPVPVHTVTDTLRSYAGDGAAQTATLAAQHAGTARLLDAVGVAGGPT